jgi:hypothetical protein
MALLVALAVITRGQAASMRKRQGSSPQCVRDIDVTVVPTRGVLRGLPPVEMRTIGDSAMARVRVCRVSDSLPVQLAQRVADGAGRAVHVVGYALSGALTRDVLNLQLPLALGDTDVPVLLVKTDPARPPCASLG